MEFNPDRVRRISSEILIALERLEEQQRLPKERFLSDPHMIGSAVIGNRTKKQGDR